MKKDGIKEILDNHPQYRETLFCRGYIVTNRVLSTGEYPFYGLWNTKSLGHLKNSGELLIHFHPWQHCCTLEQNGISIALVGHAYNPFDMKYKEDEILMDCLNAYKKGKNDFFDKISELTGVHIIIINDGAALLVVQDCSGMQSCCYGVIQKDIYITSSPQMIADICGLEMDPFVKKLTGKWFYRFGRQYLPGNLSPHRELKKLGANTCLEFKGEFSIKRFFPLKPHPELEPSEYKNALNSIAKLMKNNIQLCLLKWKRPAISVSGGMDSRTTLACANGFYDRLKCFNFHCKPSELEDTKAATKICALAGIPLIVYPISRSNWQIKDFYLLKKIVIHNSSYTNTTPEHELRKYIYLYRKNDFDVELKSWIFETFRVMLERKYAVRFPVTLTPRHFSIFQTRYIFDSAILLKSDEYYRQYLEKINLAEPLYNYKHTDSFYWEFAYSFWGQQVVNAQNIFRHTVTMPLNNRKMLDMAFSFPKEYRKQDMVQKEIMNIANKNIGSTQKIIKNPYLGYKKILLEKLYYRYAMLLSHRKCIK